MIDIHLLDVFKDDFLSFIKEECGEKLNQEELYLSEDDSIVSSIQQDIKNLNLSIELFIQAKISRDKLAMMAALLRINTFMSGITGVFDQTSEDIVRFIKLSDDISFPQFSESYKIPEHYNYPLK